MATTALEGLLRTVGPFLIPAVIFAVGVCFYLLLWFFTRRTRDDYRSGENR
jgi:nitrogen fixation-related uncharacterized protein